MTQNLDSKTARDLASRAVTALAGEEAATKVAPSLEAMFELARETAIANSSGKRQPVITLVKVSVGGLVDGQHEPITTAFSKGKPIATGPQKRVPIRTGGGSCITIKIYKLTVTICAEWES